MIELTQKEIYSLQQTEKSILQHFIQVCEKLQLTYYIVAGTLLGAVRHQGFIPWDDDIDVAMPRQDYEVLLSHGQKYLPENLFLQTRKTDPDFPANFCKLRNSNTTFIEASIANHNINHGVYIDIFPLDFYPSKNKHLYNIYFKLQSIRITDAFASSSGMKKITRFVRFFTRFMYPTVTDALNAREILVTDVPPSQTVPLLINNFNNYRKRDIFPSDWYGCGVTLMFEGLPVNAPAQFHNWLTQIYGDYIQLPPKEKRIPHHFVSAFDLERPYTSYTET